MSNIVINSIIEVLVVILVSLISEPIIKNIARLLVCKNNKINASLTIKGVEPNKKAWFDASFKASVLFRLCSFLPALVIYIVSVCVGIMFYANIFGILMVVFGITGIITIFMKKDFREIPHILEILNKKKHLNHRWLCKIYGNTRDIDIDILKDGRERVFDRKTKVFICMLENNNGNISYSFTDDPQWVLLRKGFF